MSPANHSSTSELFQQIGQRALQGGVIPLEGHQLPDGGKVNLEHIAAEGHVQEAETGDNCVCPSIILHWKDNQQGQRQLYA
jgi:hypothetical protein